MSLKDKLEAQKAEKWRKRAKLLLLSANGRAALKDYGISVEAPEDQKQNPAEQKPIVCILCPTYRAPEPQMQDALGRMVRYTREKDIATVYAGAPLSASVVHWSRNGLITEQLKSGKPWTHILFVDDDIVVEEDHLEKLLSHKKDIVAGLCTRRTDPPIPNIRHFNEETGDFGQIWEWPEGQLLEVGGVGTGLMLITQHALEQVAQSYFDCLWEKEFYGISSERAEEIKTARLKAFDEQKLCYWFRFLPAFKSSIEYGEDVGFCMVAKRYAGISSYCDTSIQPGHIGHYSYSIRDFEPYREQSILKAKVHGQYPMDVPEMKISILCPTRGRPENIKRLIDSLLETSTVMPEIVLYRDLDDCTPGPEFWKGVEIKNVLGPRITLSKMWNRCAEVSTGEILMHAGDDIVFKTKGWDDYVRRAFAAFPDRLVFVHGDDGVYGDQFGTHGFLHRAWIETVGYFCPPYFSSDYNDTWLNEVASAIGRRVPLPFVTEHMHPLTGKAEWDKTHKERLERHKADNVDELYQNLAPARAEDIRKLKARLGVAFEQKPELVLA
ncbi:MAG: glycosyltransferase family 2 protein [Acidobacteria bacterium]|nr:glycosyltransferase family 2 protein [Acidobacteriota bacterium]